MLEAVDLNQKLSKKEYKAQIGDLENRLGELQRAAKERGIPIVLVFEGWDAAGKGTLINALLLTLDPRGFSVHPINPPTDEEKFRPYLWRFWRKIPPAGRIAIFDRSWYGRVLVARVDKLVKRKVWSAAYNQINSFERQLADAGYVILKVFLHIDKKVQKKRFKKLAKNRATAWKVTKEDWKHHRQYDKYLLAYEDMLARTDRAHAPWVIVESHNRRHATVRLFRAVIEAIETRIAVRDAAPAPAPIELSPVPGSTLDKADLTQSLDREEYQESLQIYQKRVRELEHEVYGKRIPVVIVYEGWDAAGKGGNIKRLVAGLDPRGYEVVPIGAPNDVEKARHYLWRFWLPFPKAGHLAIFDRSWYGRVMVERVEGFCAEAEWKRSFQEINEMEEQWARFGTVIVKFWIHIDKEEQLRRFQARQENPYKEWKITEEDWRNREKWDQYREAVDELLYRTSTSHAPWTVVESNCKWFARIKALKTVIDAIEDRL